jgi:hypothetical protein
MGGTQPKPREAKPENKLQGQPRVSGYESNTSEFGKIKHTLKYLHKNNFVSLTYVLFINSGRLECILHPTDLEELHNKQN